MLAVAITEHMAPLSAWHFHNSLEETTMIRELGNVSEQTKGNPPGFEGFTGTGQG